jgi:hypothetical protein
LRFTAGSGLLLAVNGMAFKMTMLVFFAASSLRLQIT